VPDHDHRLIVGRRAAARERLDLAEHMVDQRLRFQCVMLGENTLEAFESEVVPGAAGRFGDAVGIEQPARIST
jgi:hypothetical protein